MATTYEPIATTTLGGSSSSITFNSIPATYTDLRIVWVITGLSSAQDPVLRFNGSSATSYSDTWMRGRDTTAASSRDTSQAQMYLFAGIGGVASFVTIDVFDYTGSTYKNCLITTSVDGNGTGLAGKTAGTWANTSAINSVTLLLTPSGTMNSGTTATLYGILKA